MTTALEPMRQELEVREHDMRPNLTLPTPDMTALADAMRNYLPGLTSLEERGAALDTRKARLLIGPEGVEQVEITVQSG